MTVNIWEFNFFKLWNKLTVIPLKNDGYKKNVFKEKQIKLYIYVLCVLTTIDTFLPYAILHIPSIVLYFGIYSFINFIFYIDFSQKLKSFSKKCKKRKLICLGLIDNNHFVHKP